MPTSRETTLQRRLFGWILALTLAPALVILAAGGWAVATSLEISGALGPWEEVAATGLRVVDRVDAGSDPGLEAALQSHREALSRSLTQARRWAFLGDRFLDVLPFLVLGVGAVLGLLALAASHRLARGLARPIEELVAVADSMGREEPLPAPPGRALREVRVLDLALRAAAAQLAAGRDRAVAAERVRVWGEMARRVAHEMKNPLTPLRLAAHRLAADRSGSTAGAAAPQPAAVAEAVDVIGQEVARLEALAGQFSALGRPPEGPATEIDVGELVQSLLETDVPAGVAASLDAPPTLPTVAGHHDALVRAFRNLIRNAVEATETAAAPSIVVTIRERRPGVAGAAGGEGGTGGGGGEWLEARIADNGPGLPPGAAERIFEPDFTTKKRGTGLGLALVRQAIEAHGGEVAAEAGVAGATFVVRLPLEQLRTHPAERTQNATRST